MSKEELLKDIKFIDEILEFLNQGNISSATELLDDWQIELYGKIEDLDTKKS